MTYRERIAAITIEDPVLVECWMRLECGTLDALSPNQFRAEATNAAYYVRDFPDESLVLAASYGLKPGVPA